MSAGEFAARAQMWHRGAARDWSNAMPGSAPKVAIGLSLAVLLAGTTYLYAVRGSALLVDLSTLGSRIFCF